MHMAELTAGCSGVNALAGLDLPLSLSFLPLFVDVSLPAHSHHLCAAIERVR